MNIRHALPSPREKKRLPLRLLCSLCALVLLVMSAAPAAMAAKTSSGSLQVEALPENLYAVPDCDTFRMYPASMRYFWMQLTEHEKELFALVYTAIDNYQTRLSLPRNTYTEQEIARVRFVINEDCPELIQLRLCWYDCDSSTRMATAARMSYIYDRNWGPQRFAAMKPRLDALVQNAAALEDDFERELFLYKSIITMTEYNTESRQTQSADCVFVEGISVCAGYADSMTLACRMAGIPCFTVSGYAYLLYDPTVVREWSEANSHAWNAVKIGGSWYFADPTWDDPLPLADQEIPLTRSEYMLYFNLSEAELSETHDIDYRVYTGWDMPEFNATEDSFFARNLPNAVVEGHWQDELQAQVDALPQSGRKDVVLIFSTVEERDRVRYTVNKTLQETLKQLGWKGYVQSSTFFDYPILILDLSRMTRP